MFCSNCGRQIENHETFCSKCGARIGAPSTPGDPGNQPLLRMNSAGLRNISSKIGTIPTKAPIYIFVSLVCFILALTLPITLFTDTAELALDALTGDNDAVFPLICAVVLKTLLFIVAAILFFKVACLYAQENRIRLTNRYLIIGVLAFFRGISYAVYSALSPSVKLLNTALGQLASSTSTELASIKTWHTISCIVFYGSLVLGVYLGVLVVKELMSGRKVDTAPAPAAPTYTAPTPAPAPAPVAPTYAAPAPAPAAEPAPASEPTPARPGLRSTMRKSSGTSDTPTYPTTPASAPSDNSAFTSAGNL